MTGGSRGDPVRARLALRGAAVAIAILAAVDPAITIARHDRALISMVVGDSPDDSVLARRVAGAMSADFEVVPVMLQSADAAVVVGTRLPDAMTGFSGPAFALVRDPGDGIVIERVSVPRTVSVDEVPRVTATVRVRGARGRVVVVSLRADGVAVDQVRRTIVTDDERFDLNLAAPPPAIGALALRLAAGFERSARAEAVADGVVDVAPRRPSVLVYDGRPSWMSTFVRRALDSDPRFTVASRTVTSPGVARDAGAPLRLDDARARDNYDVVVVGAPDALADRDVAALEDFLRLRGGSVVLLPDSHDPGAYDRLAGVTAWGARDGGAPLRVSELAVDGVASDSIALRAAEIAWPVVLPAGAERVAVVASDSAQRTVVWSASVGAGRMTMSGALDAWRYRDSSQSGFDRFWTNVVAAGAARAIPALDVDVVPAVARPGERVTIGVTIRDVALGGRPGRRTAIVEGRLDGAAVPLRFIPDVANGRLVATIRAPDRDGAYRAIIRANGREATAPLLVSAGAVRATGRPADLLQAWVASHRGAVIGEHDIRGLPAALRTAIAPAGRTEQTHPMRSPWWIVPFALLLSGEWLIRRRHGWG